MTYIVIFSDDIVVTTPHGEIAINYTSSMDHPTIYMAVIHTKREEEVLDGTRTFRYVVHTKQTATVHKTAKNCETGPHPWITPKMHKCATIEAKIHGCKVYIMIDTGSTGNFVSPAFAKITGMKTFPLEQQLTLQLGYIGSHSKITHSSKTTIELGNRTSTLYLDIANINCYDYILGIPFLRGHKVILNFADQQVYIGNIKITFLEEFQIDSCFRQLAG